MKISFVVAFASSVLSCILIFGTPFTSDFCVVTGVSCFVTAMLYLLCKEKPLWINVMNGVFWLLTSSIYLAIVLQKYL